MAPTIEASGLSKRYGKTIALDGLDLLAERGEVVAVLGPNGAGKTTFVRAVATLLRPDAGTLRVAGHDVRRSPEAVRRLIGLAGQFAAVEPAMTGRENLEMGARLAGRENREGGAPPVGAGPPHRQAQRRSGARAARPRRGRRPPRTYLLRRHA